MSIDNLRDTILSATALPHEDVQLSDLGVTVRVRGMTAAELETYQEGCMEGRGRKRRFTGKDAHGKLVSLCCIDPETGMRIFSDADIQRLGQVRADILQRLFGIAARLSGIRDEDIDELGQPSANQTAPDSSSSTSPLSSA